MYKEITLYHSYNKVIKIDINKVKHVTMERSSHELTMLKML
jgi:hypothetical protein